MEEHGKRDRTSLLVTSIPDRVDYSLKGEAHLHAGVFEVADVHTHSVPIRIEQTVRV